jgi:hypothetical protein
MQVQQTHKMKDRKPYTYEIIFRQEGHKYDGFKYIGAKWAKGCKPETFWVDYFTTSKIIKELIENYGIESFKSRIIESNYSSIDECVAHECELLKEVDAKHNPVYFNQCNGDPKYFIKFVTEETKLKKKEKFQEKFKADCMFESEYFKEKSKDTNLRIRKVDNSAKDPKVRAKAKKTLFENYKVDSPLESPIILERFKETNRELYEADYSAQNPIIFAKTKLGCFKRFGVEFAAQDPIIKEQILETKRNNSIPFICENDGRIWKLQIDAAKFYNVQRACLGRCLAGNQKTTNWYRFHYVSDKPEKIIRKRPKRKFICENDGRIWDKQCDAVTFYGVNKNCIGYCLEGRSPITKGYKFHYIEEKIK